MEQRAVRLEAAERPVHRRGCEGTVGFRGLTIMASAHEPVMVSEVVALLAPGRGGLFVDCTVGLGGHSRALLEAGATRVIGLDRDPDALAIARDTLAPWRDR